MSGGRLGVILAARGIAVFGSIGIAPCRIVPGVCVCVLCYVCVYVCVLLVFICVLCYSSLYLDPLV